jgi:hypothetical protein
MNPLDNMAILFTHHNTSDLTLHNYNLVKKYNPNAPIFSVGFSQTSPIFGKVEELQLIEGSHIVQACEELPSNYVLDNVLKSGGFKANSSESDLLIYDFFLHHQDFSSYFMIEYDTHCNCSVEECYGNAMKMYNTFSANIFTNVVEEFIKDEVFELCAICEKKTDVVLGTPVELRKNCVSGIGQFCDECYNKFDKTKYIERRPRRRYVKDWSWYIYFFSKINEPTVQKKLLPYLGGTYPTSLLYYTHQALYDMVNLIIENPRLYDNIQNEMRLGTLLQQAGYRLEEYGGKTNQFHEQPHYREDIANGVHGYYHPIKEIL